MKTKHNKLVSGLLAAILILSLLSAPALAADRVLSVDDDGRADCTTIQDAIDRIAASDDPQGWTVEVKNGTYDRFTVPHWNKSGISDLTIRGESRDGVVIRVLDRAYTESALTDNGGINIYGKNVTLESLTVQAGQVKQSWDDAAISTNHGMSGGKDVSLTVRDCTLIGPDSADGARYGIFWACSALNVVDCRISGFSNAVEFMNDGFQVPAGETFSITGNTIIGSSFAVHGYMGGGNGGGVLEIADNVITGSDELRSKVICQDNVVDSFTVDIKNNTLDNALIGLVNLQDEGDVLSPVLTSNDFTKNSFYVEAVEPGTLEYYTTYIAPQDDNGHWALNSTADWESTNPNIDISFVQDKVDQANADGVRVLSITGLDDGTLVRTFTWLKDIIYWVSEESAPSGGNDEPGLPDEPAAVEEPLPNTADAPFVWFVLLLVSMGALIVLCCTAPQTRRSR